MSFPKDFLWGTASAAAQVEGAWDVDGRSPSIWDVAPKGKIKHDDDCHTTCDCYHLYKEDVARMKAMGLKSYRFSISWSRVVPAEGQVNPKGLEYYSDLVDELLAAGIEPMVTLYHWDLPVWVYKKGDWKYESIVEDFKDYVKAVIEALSDRVTMWMTFNEPSVFVNQGYCRGSMAPFEQQDAETVAKITRNVLVSHGEAVKVIRKYAKKTPKISIAIAAKSYTPVDESSEKSIEWARYMTFEGSTIVSANVWWADPCYLGVIPEPLKGAISEEDIKIIHQPLDYFCFNNYQSYNYTDGKSDYSDDGTKLPKNPNIYPGLPRTAMGWAITPETLYWLCKFFHDRYNLPIMISENGMASLDVVSLDGKVHDPVRCDFIVRYLANVKKACEDGIPVLGYQYWSLFDNFEWAMGFDPRFGLIYVDYRDFTRIEKDSVAVYAEIIRTNGENLPSVEVANKR